MPVNRTVEIRIGDGGIVQAQDHETGLKQLGETPGEAVDQLFAMLEVGDGD